MDFKGKVYNMVKEIPRGRVVTYKLVATAIGLPRAYRGVARALSKNLKPEVPCHRVIRSDGSLGGYNRGGSAQKAKLLRREGVLVENLKIVDIGKFSI